MADCHLAQLLPETILTQVVSLQVVAVAAVRVRVPLVFHEVPAVVRVVYPLRLL